MNIINMSNLSDIFVKVKSQEQSMYRLYPLNSGMYIKFIPDGYKIMNCKEGMYALAEVMAHITYDKIDNVSSGKVFINKAQYRNEYYRRYLVTYSISDNKKRVVNVDVPLDVLNDNSIISKDAIKIRKVVVDDYEIFAANKEFGIK
jgi:hypothetical protein